jgi:hypothetical protein
VRQKIEHALFFVRSAFASRASADGMTNWLLANASAAIEDDNGALALAKSVNDFPVGPEFTEQAGSGVGWLHGLTEDGFEDGPKPIHAVR